MNQEITFRRSSRDNKHFRILKKQLKSKLKSLPANRKNRKKHIAIFLILSYATIYAAAILNTLNIYVFFSLYAVLGIISVLIFISIIHDAVHHTIFNKKWANNAIIYVFDILGGNSFIWKKRHILLHHNYQNISGWDSDIEQAGLIKIFPDEKPTVINRNQHWLIFMLYPLYLFNWIALRDFKDFFSNKRQIRKVCKIPTQEYIKLFFFKSLFFFNTICVPVMMGLNLSDAFLALCIMLICGSIFALLLLLTPHVNETNEFPQPDAEGKLSVSWLEHQFITTNDIKVNNWFTRNFMGNFNFHLAHHLFPNINSVYAPEVTSVIRKYAEDNNLLYRSYGLKEALISHYRLIKNNALTINLLEEDM